MDRKDIRKLVVKEFGAYAKSKGFKRNGTSLFWYKEQNDIICYIGYECASDIRPYYAIQPHYIGLEPVCLSWSKLISHCHYREYSLYDEWEDNVNVENLNRLIKYFDDGVLDMVLSYCDAKRLTGDLPFTQLCMPRDKLELNGFSKLYLGDYNGAIEALVLANEDFTCNKHLDFVIEMAKNHKELVPHYLSYLIDKSKRILLSFEDYRSWRDSVSQKNS